MEAFKSDLTTELSSTALSYTSSSNNRKFKLSELTIHFSGAITETVTVTRVSGVSSNYNSVLAKRSMVAEQDFVFRPQGKCDFQSGDEVKVECTNANTMGIGYVTIKRRELS